MKISKDKYKEILEIQGINYNENSKWFTVSLNRINEVLTIPVVVVPEGTLCEYCGEELQEGTNLDYCKNDYCTQ